MSELRTLLETCGYPEHLISEAFHDAALRVQGPYKDKSNTLTFVTIYHSNVDNKSLVEEIWNKVNNSVSAYLKKCFPSQHFNVGSTFFQRCGSTLK